VSGASKKKKKKKKKNSHLTNLRVLGRALHVLGANPFHFATHKGKGNDLDSLFAEGNDLLVEV